MTKYYIKATGSVCYDKTGITFPEKIVIDFDSLLKNVENVQWENYHGWDNLPEVVTFYGSVGLVAMLDMALPNGLLVSEHWAG